MQLPSVLLENAVNEFAKLPGIGKKTALRMVLHLLKQDVHVVQQFGATLSGCGKRSGSANDVITWQTRIFALYVPTQ